MLSPSRILGLLALLAALASAAAGAGEARFSPLFTREATDLQAEARAARAEGRKLAVAFTLPDCPGCREMERTVFQDPGVTARFSRHYRSVKVDLARSEPILDLAGRRGSAGDFARQLGAFATPSFAFFDGRGEFLYRHTGTLAAADFSRLGQYVAKAEYEQYPFAGARAAQAANAPRLQADAPAAGLPRRPEFRLADTTGKVRRLADFRGQAVALAVGYSQCPDVCPTTLAEMAAILEQLGEAGKRVQPIFISVDPQRDTPKVLGNYVAFFNPRILGLTGSPALVRGVADNFKARYEKVQEPGSDQYWMDHSAGMYLLGPDSGFVAKFPYAMPAAEITARIKAQLDATPEPTPREQQAPAGAPPRR